MPHLVDPHCGTFTLYVRLQPSTQTITVYGTRAALEQLRDTLRSFGILQDHRIAAVTHAD